MIADFAHEFRRLRRLAEAALADLGDAAFFAPPAPAPAAKPVAVVVKHVAGNLRSRWTDFPAADGEKPDRDRDGEFVLGPGDTRPALMAAWAAGWEAVLGALGPLQDADLGRIVAIRGEPHTVVQAAIRSVSHTAYHVGQIMQAARTHRPDAAWHTIPPGGSAAAPHYGGPRLV